MKALHNNTPFRIVFFSLCIWTLFLGSFTSLQAQMQGSYTIGGTGVKNFSSWSQFADSLNKNGVSGKVEISVKADLTEKAVIQLKQHSKSPITKTNSLIIKGGAYYLKGNQNKEILHLDGIDFLSISKLNVENTNAKGRAAGIRLSNQADSNTLDSCTILLANMQVDVTDTSAYVVFGSDTTMTKSTTINNGSYNIISNCIFKTKGGGGPRFAIIDQQSRSAYTTSSNRNIFRNNRIQNFYSGVFLLRFVNGEVVENNIIDRLNATSADGLDTAMVLFQLQGVRNGSQATQIRGNIIENLPYTGSYTAGNSEVIRITGVNLVNCRGNDSVYLSVEGNVFRNFRMKQEFVGIMSRRNQSLDFGGNGFNSIVSDKGMAYGISVFNSKDFKVERNTFYNNTFNINSKNYVWFIYMYENENSKGKRNIISDNLIDSNESHYLAAMWYYGLCDYDIKRNRIVNNRILSEDYSAFIGLETRQVGNVDVISNLIANNHCKGQMLFLYSENYTSGSTYNAYYNTISMEDSFSQYTYHYLSFFYDQSDVNFVGNVIEARGNSTSEVYVSYMERVGKMEDNNFYLRGNFSMENWVIGNSIYTDFTSWSQDVNVSPTNFWGNPKFYKPRKVDFRCGSTKNQNSTKASSFSDFDVYGKKRNAGFHDLGAVEDRFDLALKVGNVSLADSVCSGYELTPEFWITNNFWDTVKSFNVSVGANGSWTNENFTKTILPGDSVKVSLSAPVRLNNIGSSDLRFALNTSNDFLQNDTVVFRTHVKAAPGGSGFVAIMPSSGNKPVYGVNNPLDKTIKNLEIGYKVSAPKNKIQADYGKTWTASAQAYNASGKAIAGASIVAPNASDSLKWMFVTGDSLLDDSTLVWQLKISDLTNGCDTVYTKMLYISPTPKVNFSVNQGLCNGDTLRFVNSTAVASSRVFLYYNWNFGTGRVGDTSDLFEPQFRYDSAGIYKVGLKIVSMPDNFIFGMEKLLDVKARPKVAFDRDNACDGLPVNFTNKSTPSSAKMTWNFGKGDTVISKMNFQQRFVGAGSYWVTLKAEVGECSQSESIRIVVYEQPKAQFDLASGTCQYDKYSFTNKTVMTSSLFGSVWNFDELDSRSTDKSPSYTYQTAGSKRVGLRIKSEFGCIDSIAKTIQVKAAPLASIGVMDTCNLRVGKIYNTTADVAGVKRSLSWELDGKAKGGADTLSEAWNGNTGTFAVRLRVDFDNGCFDEVQRTITVLKELKSEFTFEEACSGDTVYFKNTTVYESGDKVSWYWDFADGTVTSDFEQNHAFVSDKTKTLNVLLRSTLNDACVSQVVKPVTVWETPRTCEFIGEPDYEKAYYALKFEPAANGVRGGQDNVGYQWFLKGYSEQNSVGANAAVVYTLSEDGEYEMRMIATTEDHGCSCTAKGIVKLDRLLTESLMAQVRVYPNPSSGKFKLSSSDAGAIDVQVWGLNGALLWQKTNVNDGDVMDFSHFSEGNYIIRLSDDSGKVANQMLTIMR